jgi:hypothetical protein
MSTERSVVLGTLGMPVADAVRGLSGAVRIRRAASGSR